MAGRLDRAADDPDVAQPFAGLVLLEVECAAFDHHGRREPVVVVLVRRRGELREGFPHQVRPPGRALGGVVGHLVVVAGDPGVGRAARVECTETVAIAVGDGEDFRHWSSQEWPVR